MQQNPISPNEVPDSHSTEAQDGVGDDSGESLAPVGRESTDVESEAQNGETEVETQEEQGNEDMPEVDDEAQEEFRRQRRLRDPGQPTPEERAEHEETHIPYRPWCWHCVYGKAKKSPSRTLCGAYSQGHCARVRMVRAEMTTGGDRVDRGQR